MNAVAQDRLVRRIKDKVDRNHARLLDVREDGIETADVVVVSYGITSRIAGAAVEAARARGLRVGHLRLVITWPFPSERVAQIATTAKAFVVPELNMGQMSLEVERAVTGRAKVRCVPHAGGTVHDPEVILDAIMEVSR